MKAKPSLCPAIDAARAAGRQVLLEHESHDILDSLGIRAPQQMAIAIDEAAAAARFACEWIPGDRVVLKAASDRILHKSDVGGVRFVEKSPEAIVTTLTSMERQIAAGRYTISEIVQHDLAPGSELLLGIRWTADFGAVVSLAAGGVATEFLASNIREGRELAVFSPDMVSEDEIDSILASKAITPLVTGGVRRQKPRCTPFELRKLIVRCLDFARDHLPDDLLEIEINPLVPTPRGFFALDAIVRVGQTVTKEPERPIGKIAALLRARSVAVAGVSGRGQNAGRVIVRNLIEDGFDASRVWIIKPGETRIDGCACVPDISSLPERVDSLVLSIPAEQVPAAIEEIVQSRKAESVIVIPGGLGEHAGSQTLEQSIRETLRHSRETDWGGPVVNGANCLGIHSRPAQTNTIFIPRHKLRSSGSEASLALVSQSGALAIALETRLGAILPRYVISIGNQIDLTVGDYMRYFAEHPSEDVIAFYVEGFRPFDGRRWLEAATAAVRNGRTVILYRAGRTSAGAQATQSHTAAIAGEYVVTRELAAGAGVLVADSLDEFADLIRVSTLLQARRPRGMRAGAMSNAGFETVAIADRAAPFELVTLSEATRQQVSGVLEANRLGRIVTITNPLDVNPMLGDEAFARIVEILLRDENVDACVIGCVPMTGALATLPDEIDSPDSVVTRLGAIARQSDKPFVCVIDGGPLYDAMALRLEEHGIPAFRSADRAVSTFAKWCAAAIHANDPARRNAQSLTMTTV